MSSRPTFTTPPDDYVRVGRLGKSFKLDGGVRLLMEAELDDVELETLLDSRPRMFVAGLGETRLRGSDTRTGTLVVLFEGVRDRTAARALVNAPVWVNADDLTEDVTAPTAEESLASLPVVVDGETWGEVVAANLNGVNPLVEVRSASGVVSLVSLAAPYVQVTEDALLISSPPAGLLD